MGGGEDLFPEINNELTMTDDRRVTIEASREDRGGRERSIGGVLKTYDFMNLLRDLIAHSCRVFLDALH